MTAISTLSDLEECAQSFFSKGQNLKQFETFLEEQKWSEDQKNAAIQHFKKLQSSRRFRIGILMVASGCVLCFFGFAATLYLMQHHSNFHFVLYGATGLGGLLILAGVGAIMG